MIKIIYKKTDQKNPFIIPNIFDISDLDKTYCYDSMNKIGF